MAVVFLHTAEKPEKKVHIDQADVSNKLWVILTHLKPTHVVKKKSNIKKKNTQFRKPYSTLFIAVDSFL